MSTEYWVVSPGGNNSNGTDSQIVGTTVGSANDSALLNGGTVTISGKTYSRYLGPFTSEAAAASAHPESGTGFIGYLIGAGAASAAEGATGGVAGTPGTSTGASATAAAGNAGSATATSVSSWENALEGFFQAFTSANTWIRVAKVVGGGVILVVGLAKLTGADQKIGGIAAKAVKAAPLL